MQLWSFQKKQLLKLVVGHVLKSSKIVNVGKTTIIERG